MDNFAVEEERKEGLMLNIIDCRSKLTTFKEQYAQQYGIRSIGIFGSVARQDNIEGSDIDIVVDLDEPTLAGMYSLRMALTNLFGCDVDLVRMRKSLPELLRSNIERDVIYA